MLLTAANQTVQMADNLSGVPRLASAFGDAQGVWIGGAGSLWLYRSGALFKVADVPIGSTGGETPMAIANATGGIGELPAARVVGPCI
jgi:hypothetical protein